MIQHRRRLVGVFVIALIKFPPSLSAFSKVEAVVVVLLILLMLMMMATAEAAAAAACNKKSN